MATLPLEGTQTDIAGLLKLLYAQSLNQALRSELRHHPERLRAALELAHKYNFAGLISGADDYFAKQYGPQHHQYAGSSTSSTRKIKAATDWLKFACQTGLAELQLCVEHYLMHHEGAHTFARLPGVAHMPPQAQQRFLESVLRILRASTRTEDYSGPVDIARIKAWRDGKWPAEDSGYSSWSSEASSNGTHSQTDTEGD